MFHNSLKYIVIVFICVLCACGGQMPKNVDQAYQALPEKIDFNFHVRPILSDRCYACHGPDENAREADLRLDLEEDASQAIVSRQPYKSELIKRVLSTDPDMIMPTPESKLSLTDREKAILIKWIEDGAEWKGHWAYTVPVKEELPIVKSEDLIQNPIDNFILAKLEEEGTSFSQQADKATLLRRLSLDMTGLPPTLEEVDVFLQDESNQAVENLIDKLMSKPAFGERWAWDWLDAARYADTNGFQGDPTRKMYPWRDWVVSVINNNKPFDQFTVEQLAGDLIPDATNDQILATAFNRNHMYNGEGGRIPEETRVENVYDRLETTGTIFMGMTLNCTRCHDHKFDPISQKEYFQLYDYFNQTSEEGLNGNGMIAPVLNLSPPMEREKVMELQAFVDELDEEVKEYESKKFPSETGVPADSPAAAHLNGDDAYVLTFEPAKRNTYYIGKLAKTFNELDDVYVDKLGRLRDALNKRNGQASSNLQVMVMDEIDRHRSTYILEGGIYDKPSEVQVSMDVPQILPALPEDAPKNRLALATWIVSKEHPLTARVTVNRFWQAIFGKGLVKTTDDFGIQGSAPSHPGLLDWLAVDFVEHGWDVKRLIKQMVMSRTYQQSSKLTDEQIENDPENILLGRSPRYRLPSWMIRDQALALSGLLKDSIGGKPVKPYQPEGIWSEATFGKIEYEQDEGDNLYRRTLYTFWRRIVGPTMLFDNSSRQVCSVKPILTNSPQHALITLNDITFLEAARVMAERVILKSQSVSDRLEYAFRTATSRMPTSKERVILEDKVVEFQEHFSSVPDSALAFIQIGDFRQNEQVDPIEQAAYTSLCSMILNMDEVLSKQ